MRFSFDSTIERGDDAIDVRVIYEVSPFVPATYLQPAEGGEVEIVSVKHEGAELTPTDAEEAALLRECEARAEADIADEAADAAEWRAQDRRDRLLMGDD